MIDTIIKRFASKVDSLNWQSISYQKKAFETVNDQIYKAVMEILGEDNGCGFCGDIRQKEQRQKVNQLFGKGENN